MTLIIQMFLHCSIKYSILQYTFVRTVSEHGFKVMISCRKKWTKNCSCPSSIFPNSLHYSPLSSLKLHTNTKSQTHTFTHTHREREREQSFIYTHCDSQKLLSEYHSIFRLTGLVKQYRGVSRVVAFNRTIALLLSRVIVLCSGADH